MHACCAASVNVSQYKLISVFGTGNEQLVSKIDDPALIVTELPNLSLPVNLFKISAADDENVLCPLVLKINKLIK